MTRPPRYVLFGDGESPHLLKWARALSPHMDLWVASSRGFNTGFDELVSPEKRLSLATRPDPAGGNAGLLLELPRLARWLRAVGPDWIHAHYLTSHGTLAWAARQLYGVPGVLLGSAWGSDILVAPQHSLALRWLTSRVLAACALTTSDSQAMAERMRQLGAREVMVFPFGLEAMPEEHTTKEAWLFFANRALEPIYAPHRVLRVFAGVAAWQPCARLVVANEGSLRVQLEREVAALGLTARVEFTGRLDAEVQARCYDRAACYLSLPESDSVAVSVLEAMAHGCVPVLSDLAANCELIRNGTNGLILSDGKGIERSALEAVLARADKIGRDNRSWVRANAMFEPAVRAFLARLHDLPRPSSR